MEAKRLFYPLFCLPGFWTVWNNDDDDEDNNEGNNDNNNSNTNNNDNNSEKTVQIKQNIIIKTKSISQTQKPKQIKSSHKKRQCQTLAMTVLPNITLDILKYHGRHSCTNRCKPFPRTFKRKDTARNLYKVGLFSNEQWIFITISKSLQTFHL